MSSVPTEAADLIEPWRRAQLFLKALYDPKVFVYPVDQPAYGAESQWWHFVMPFRESIPGADDSIRETMSDAAQRAIERLAQGEPQLLVPTFRIRPDFAEFVSHGLFKHRRRVRAQLGRAMATAFRRATGQKLLWDVAWAACLDTPAALHRCRTHLPASPLEPPPVISESYEEFMECMMSA